MNTEQSRLAAIQTFIKENKLIVVGVALVLLFIYIVYLSVTASPQTTPQTNTTIVPSSSVTTSITVTPAPLKRANLYEPNHTWIPARFIEDDFKDISFTESRLPDGSVKYSYESANPNRPNEIIVNKGTIVYQRAVISNKYIYHYTNTMGAPDYVYQSSRFYGSDTMTYVYLSEGTAFVADSKTTLVKEQLTFKPTTLEQFKAKYAEDIADFTIIPTEAEEEYIRAEDHR